MRIEADENGYLYMLNLVTGEKRYILVDIPNCHHYGKLILEKTKESEKQA